MMQIQITPWPNSLGWTIRQGRLRIELWNDGRVQRLVPDDSLTGYRGTHFSQVPITDRVETMATAAVTSWRRGGWEECA